MQATFPKENSYLRLENIQFVACTKIHQKDLSFETYNTPIVITQQTDEKVFCYDTFRLDATSVCKVTVPTSSDETKTLKLLSKEKSLMTNIRRKVRHMMNQGLKDRLSQPQADIQTPKLKEVAEV